MTSIIICFILAGLFFYIAYDGISNHRYDAGSILAACGLGAVFLIFFIVRVVNYVMEDPPKTAQVKATTVEVSKESKGIRLLKDTADPVEGEIRKFCAWETTKVKEYKGFKYNIDTGCDEWIRVIYMEGKWRTEFKEEDEN